MTNVHTTKDDIKTDPQLDKLLKDISERRIESAASGAALIEKARRQAELLEKDELEKKMSVLEEGVAKDLDAATAEALRSLYED
ncbi:MAG: hypothetical protein KGI49_01695 [Patescibacteria group bacterium]|nr:hypothetical protein [Patescibacteria group bacterium]